MHGGFRSTMQPLRINIVFFLNGVTVMSDIKNKEGGWSDPHAIMLRVQCVEYERLPLFNSFK